MFRVEYLLMVNRIIGYRNEIFKKKMINFITSIKMYAKNRICNYKIVFFYSAGWKNIPNDLPTDVYSQKFHLFIPIIIYYIHFSNARHAPSQNLKYN